MKTTFTARHFEASASLQEYSRDTVQKLENYYDRIVMCDIILEPSSSNEDPQQAEIILKVPKKVLTASAKAGTYEQAVHDAVENIIRQLKKYKDKMSTY
ncbi:ribosome hibernation-promoting factor, HPF/YfiA family [Balneola sp. MJW-20]|uniref:ribosome hibernation-promoting factor, HPF/YfiA family n=1 Tax=Gracilimonas aurantiaca TaxID=3234185 RepID=UPI0034672A00